MRPRLAALMLGAVLGTPALASGPAPSPETPAGVAHVLHLTSDLAYVDAGRDRGLAEGDILEVWRDGERVGTLSVTYLSSSRASCALDASSPAIEVGDEIRFVPHPAEPPPDAAASPPRPRRRGTWLNRNGIRGRVGVRYLTIRDRTADGAQLSQPALDLRVDGYGIGGSGLDVAVDVRSRRTYTTPPAGTTSRNDLTRVYRLSTTTHVPGSAGFSVTAGRQYSPLLSSISIFDGILANFGGEHHDVGAFSGTQPDPVTFGHSNEIREHGLYAAFHNAPGDARSWSIGLGAAGSYVGGEIDREFAFLQSHYNGPRLSMYLIEEVDYNRGWRYEWERRTLTPTSTFANLSLRVSRTLTLRAGYDNRRQVRLYRDRVTPETEFDDSQRAGVRLGFTVQSPVHFRLAIDSRRDDGSSAGVAESHSAYLSLVSFTSQNVGFNVRATRYTNDRVEGWLYSGSAGTDVGRRVRIEIGGGLREEIAVLDPLAQTRLTWLDVDLDFALGRRWYLLISAERNKGKLDDNEQLYTSVTYRF